MREYLIRPLDDEEFSIPYARQCCENYFRAYRVTGGSSSGGDLKERSDELRLSL
jgi:hypothetical protein